MALKKLTDTQVQMLEKDYKEHKEDAADPNVQPIR